MRCLNVLSAASLILFWAAPALAQFADVSRDELQMTADPKAPGAVAVYLYREDMTDEPGASRTFYERIKVLTEKGKEMATIRVPYEPATEKVTEIDGRTVHADGAIVPLTDKPSDLVDVKTKGFQLNSLVFTLPNVEVGSVLEYRVKVQYSNQSTPDPTWMVQQPVFVHKAHYAFKCADTGGLSYLTRMGTADKVVKGKKSTYTLDMQDIPALPTDDWMPPLNTFKWRVSFFYSRFSSEEAFWKEAGKQWANFVREFTDPTGGLKKAAAGIVASGDNETQKAQKIYAAVMKLENTDFTRHKSTAERKKEKIRDITNAEDVWKAQAGDGDELALLYVALGRAAGLNVVPMKVVDRSRAIFDDGLLTARQLDDYIAVGQLDGKEIYLDPGQKMCPFGMLHWKHAIAGGFRLVDNDGIIAHTPPPNFMLNAVNRVADLSIDESGALSGNMRVILTGQNALRWRQVALENDDDEVKKRFTEAMRGFLPEGVQGDFDHFLGMEDYGANIVGVLKISGNLGTATGKRFFLPGLFFEVRAKHPFSVPEKRTIPVDVQYSQIEQDEVTYHLPDGYSIESSPQLTSFSWTDHAKFSIRSAPRGNSINVTRMLAYNYTILGPAEYPSLHEFYQKIAEADQQQLVFTHALVAKGN